MGRMKAGSVIDSVLEPFAECLTIQAAQKIVGFRADPTIQARVDELAAKSECGTLDDAERSEYHELIETFDLVAILKSRARSVIAANRS